MIPRNSSVSTSTGLIIKSEQNKIHAFQDHFQFFFSSVTSELSGYGTGDYDTTHSLLAEAGGLQDNNNMQRPGSVTSLHHQGPASKPELAPGGLSLHLTSAWANQYMGEATEPRQRPCVTTEDGAGESLRLYFCKQNILVYRG